MSQLKGRIVLVTGASSGIGRAAALAFAARGADVVGVARRAERLEEVATQARTHGGRALAVPCDLTSSDSVEALFRRVEAELGGLDVLVNNAGIGLQGPLEAISEEQLRQVFELNVFALVRVTRAALPLLRRRPGGQIINVSSVLGHRGLPQVGGYCATKAAVNSLTESLRAELAPEGIDVLLVSPGRTESEFHGSLLHADGYQRANVPLKAMSAEAVGQAIVSASRKRRKETVLTLPGRVMVYANRWVPRLFDRVAVRLTRFPAPPPENEG